MEIQNTYSDWSTGERLFSVRMSENEVYLFSEFQREFARRDYEGLSKEAAEQLRRDRNATARMTLENRKIINNNSQGDMAKRNQAYTHNLEGNKKTVDKWRNDLLAQDKAKKVAPVSKPVEQTVTGGTGGFKSSGPKIKSNPMRPKAMKRSSNPSFMKKAVNKLKNNPKSAAMVAGGMGAAALAGGALLGN